MWQDYLIAAVIVMFTLTTIPLIRHRIRIPLTTCGPFVAGSLLLCVAYLTLDLWLSLGIEVVSASLWSIILARALRSRLDPLT